MKPRYGLFSVFGSMPEPMSLWMVTSIACCAMHRHSPGPTPRFGTCHHSPPLLPKTGVHTHA